MSRTEEFKYNPEALSDAPEIEAVSDRSDFSENFKSDDEGYLSAGQGRNTGTRVNRSRADQPISSFTVKGQKVPFNHEKMYEDWRATKRDPLIPAWNKMEDSDRANWQFEHPEGRALMAAAKRKAVTEGPHAFDSEFTPHQLSSRQSEQKMIHATSLFPTPEKGETFLNTGKLSSMSDPDDTSDELDYHKAWFAPTTSKPEIGWAPHADNSSFEGLHNLIHNTVQRATGTHVEELPNNNEIGKHARNGLASVARAAMYHTVGLTDKAQNELNGAAKHVQNMLSTIKGAQMSAGMKVSAAPDSDSTEAARLAAGYSNPTKGPAAQQRAERINRREKF